MLAMIISYILIRFILPKMAPDSPDLQGENLDIDGKELSKEEKMRRRVVALAEKLNRIVASVWQVIAGIAILPILTIATSLIISIISIATSTPNTLTTFRFEEAPSLMDIANFATPSLVIFALVVALIPLLYLTYLATVLLLRKEAKWWVFFVALAVWLSVGISGFYAHRDEINSLRQNEHLTRQISDELD